MVGLISLLTVIRHTRVEEETGRRELLGSAVVGRAVGSRSLTIPYQPGEDVSTSIRVWGPAA
jgi:hypothetical protein